MKNVMGIRKYAEFKNKHSHVGSQVSKAEFEGRNRREEDQEESENTC